MGRTSESNPSSPDAAEAGRADVMVVGAGLAGLWLTRELSRSGLGVTLVDHKRDLTQGVHTTGIFVRRTLEDFPLPEDCLGSPVRDVSLYSPGRRRLDLSSPHDEFRVGLMPRLYATLLDECRRDGVDVRLGTRFEGLTPGADGRLEAQLRGDDRTTTHTARFLVGADGATSRVAAALGLSENREWIVGVEEVLRGVPLEGPPCFHCVIDPAIAPGYLAWIVHDGHEVHLGVGGYAARFDPWPALEQFRQWAGSVVDLRRAELIEKRGGRIPVGGVLPKLACPLGLLVGDAAGAVSPLTAGGLDPCLRMTQQAAGVIQRHLAGDAGALSHYDGRLFRAKFRSRLWMRWGLRTVRSRWLLEAACGMLRVWPLRRVAEHVFFGRGSFPDAEAE
ncbi:MAG: NAD(P)/FAD-dependent oxidoreductase [Planctomycetaceae bacterium]